MCPHCLTLTFLLPFSINCLNKKYDVDNTEEIYIKKNKENNDEAFVERINWNIYIKTRQDEMIEIKRNINIDKLTYV